MTIWKDVLATLQKWPWHKENNKTPDPPEEDRGEAHVQQARESLRSLLDDPNVPALVRKSLADDLAHVQAMLDKLECSHIHIAIFGRVSVGKSALVNALIGENRFSTSPIHGETREAQAAAWDDWDKSGVFFIDTPGINDAEGEQRERLAHQVASRADLIVFVVDGDLTASESRALKDLIEDNRAVVLVLNKVDLLTQTDRDKVLSSIKARMTGLIPEHHIVTTSASPSKRIYIQVDEKGQETTTTRDVPPNTEELRKILWEILEAEGKTLAALNASLFAGKISDNISERIMLIKNELSNSIIRSYCIAKGVLVGLNPVPVSDLIAAGAVDISLVSHLSRVYGQPFTYSEAGNLVKTIGAQIALLMGTVWAINFISAVLKGGTAGLSTVLTATAQGAIAYYSAYIVGQAAQRYFAQGRSWGPKGPKRVVQDILDTLDRDSLLADAREQILARIRTQDKEQSK